MLWILALLGCSPRMDGAAEGVPRVDQIEWLHRLVARRPVLMRQFGNRVDDPAWKALVLSPEYRPRLLVDDKTTARHILTAEYSAEERRRDRTWAAEHGDGAYASRRVGTPRFQPDNLVFKSFFGFRDPVRSLDRGSLDQLTRALASGGFIGAFKVDLRPGATRFHYHHLIMYAEFEQMAACGEHIVAVHAGPELQYTSRGIDTPASYTQGVRTNWHHLLLADGWRALPPRAHAYVRYDTPLGSPCDLP